LYPTSSHPGSPITTGDMALIQDGVGPREGMV
jgi:hypothetical protein